jgi:hypothetical protein
MNVRLLLTLLLFTAPALAQSDSQPLAARVSEMLNRLSSGHSPTPEEIAAVQTLTPLPDAAEVKAALPAIEKALASPDRDAQTYILTLLNALTVAPTVPEQPAGSTAPAPAPTPAAFKPEVARALAPAIPQIAAHLTDETQATRILTTIVLGGFASDPPPAVFPPLLAYLKSDHGIGTTGAEVVSDLLVLGPISDATAEAIAAYLRRADQTSESRANLVDAVAGKPVQNQVIDKALLSYLRSDDSSLRARLILSLPQLDLSPDDFADTKARVAAYAALDPAGGQEALPIINAAKAITTCWTQVKMTAGCPVY